MNSNKGNKFSKQGKFEPSSPKNSKNLPSSPNKSVLRPPYLLSPDKATTFVAPKPPLPFCWGVNRPSNQKPIVQKTPPNSNTFVKLSSIVNKNQQNNNNKLLIPNRNDSSLKNEGNVLPKINGAPNLLNGKQEKESKPPEESVVNCWESLASSSDDEERLPENVDVKPSPVIKQFQWPVLTCEEDADWREKFVSLPEQFRYMLYNNIRTDCSFIVGSDKRERFHCHKVQLCRASSVFDSMLFDPTFEKGEISLSNIEPGTFKEIVEYIYTDKLELLSAGAALSLCRAANLYKMSRLRDTCELYLRDNLQTEWLWPALEFSMQLPETNSLRDKCLEFLRANTRSCLDTANFMQIEQSTLAWLLQQDLLDIESEMDLISAVTCWAVNKTGGLFDGEATGSNLLRELLGTSFSHLRFLSLSPEQFSLCLSDSELLSEHEKLSILVNLVTPGNMSLPDGICSITKPRYGTEFQTEFSKMTSNLCKCYRPIVKYNNENEGRQIQSSPLLVTTQFESSCDITLLGIEVTTQFNDKLPDNILDSRFVAYQENIDLSILEILPDSTLQLLHQVNYNKSVSYNAQVAIKFKEPIAIKKKKKYLIGAHYNCQGRYLDYVRVSIVEFQGNVFNFNYAENDGMIETIIFR